MSATEKIYDLLSDIECPDVFLDNHQKLRIAEYLAKKNVVPVVQCIACKHARQLNKTLRKWYGHGVLMCTYSSEENEPARPVAYNHFCKRGKTMPMVKASEATEQGGENETD